MAKKKQATPLSTDAISALRASSFEGNIFTLPEGHLDCYAEIKSLMAALGGKWMSKKRHMAFAAGVNCETLVLAACDRGEIPASNPLDFFPTPPDIVEELTTQRWLSERWGARLVVAEDRPLRYCEPNGGSGALVAVMAAKLRPGDDLVVVEKNPLLAAMLRTRFPQATVIEGDFLDYTDPKPFDVILMNPPFDGKTYQKHVNHAASMLARFGVLASIVPSSFVTHGDEFLFSILSRGEWYDLGGDRFADTDTATSVIFIENDPDGNWREKPYEGYSTQYAWNTAMSVASDADMVRKLTRAEDFAAAVCVLKGWASQQVREGSCVRIDESIAREVIFDLSDGYNMEGLTHLLGTVPSHAQDEAAPEVVEVEAPRPARSAAVAEAQGELALV